MNADFAAAYNGYRPIVRLNDGSVLVVGWKKRYLDSVKVTGLHRIKGTILPTAFQAQQYAAAWISQEEHKIIAEAKIRADRITRLKIAAEKRRLRLEPKRPIVGTCLCGKLFTSGKPFKTHINNFPLLCKRSAGHRRR